MITNSELAYLAGIFDGEGYTASRQYQCRKASAPRMQITNTDERLSLWIRSRVGGGIFVAAAGGNRKKCYHWQATGARCIILLRAMRPLLIVKGEAADKVLGEWDRTLATMEQPERRIYQSYAVAQELAALHSLGGGSVSG